MQDNRRRADRKVMIWDCVMATAAGALIGKCSVRDISSTGARITLSDPHHVPDAFVLILSRNGGARRNCELIWRDKSQIGVRFIRPAA